MKIKYELNVEVGSKLPINIDILNSVFPIIESTCDYGFNNRNWKDYLGNKQGGINAISVESIEVLHIPTHKFSVEKAALLVKWKNFNGSAYVITEVKDIEILIKPTVEYGHASD